MVFIQLFHVKLLKKFTCHIKIIYTKNNFKEPSENRNFYHLNFHGEQQYNRVDISKEY